MSHVGTVHLKAFACQFKRRARARRIFKEQVDEGTTAQRL